MGHTYLDINQAFSGTYESPNSNNAVTLDDLYKHIKETFDSTAIVSRLQLVANWSELC